MLLLSLRFSATYVIPFFSLLFFVHLSPHFFCDYTSKYLNLELTCIFFFFPSFPPGKVLEKEENRVGKIEKSKSRKATERKEWLPHYCLCMLGKYVRRRFVHEGNYWIYSKQLLLIKLIKQKG